MAPSRCACAAGHSAHLPISRSCRAFRPRKMRGKGDQRVGSLPQERAEIPPRLSACARRGVRGREFMSGNRLINYLTVKFEFPRAHDSLPPARTSRSKHALEVFHHHLRLPLSRPPSLPPFTQSLTPLSHCILASFNQYNRLLMRDLVPKPPYSPQSLFIHSDLDSHYRAWSC